MTYRVKCGAQDWILYALVINILNALCVKFVSQKLKER